MQLRPYQTAAIDRVRDAYRRGHRRVLLVLSTGAGKTHTAASLIDTAVARGRRVVFAVHLRFVVQDTARRLRDAGLRVGVVMAGVRPDPDAPVQVCSVATLAARGYHPPADFLIFDECHHVVSATWAAIAAHYKEAHALGLTATPERADGAGLGDIFDALVVGAQAAELVSGGYLAPVDALVDGTDATDVALDAVTAVERYAADRRVVVFAGRVAWSKTYAERGGPGWAHVDGTMAHGKVATELDRFRLGEVRVLTQVNMLTEGWDMPSADCVVLGRHYKHPGQYLQAAGRCLRVDPVRPDKRALIVDLCGNVSVHGLPTDPREYSLGDDPIKGKAPSLRLCPVCGATRRDGDAACWRCGAPYAEPPPAPKGRGAALVAYTGAQKRQLIADLRVQAKAEGRSPVWIHETYHATVHGE